MGALRPPRPCGLPPEDIFRRESCFLFSKYPGELEGQRPSSAEEEAKPDDETKD
jgi:hypothetical protein